MTLMPSGMVAYLRTWITNGAVEALNGIIQTVKPKARDFRTVEHFTAIIYLAASTLTFSKRSVSPMVSG